MLSMVEIILEISSEEADIFSMAVFSSLTCSTLMPNWAPACPTYWPASSAAAEVFLALSDMPLIVAASSSTELACSIEPWLKFCAPLETWLLAEDTWPAEPWTCISTSLSDSFIWRMESRMFWKLPT